MQLRFREEQTNPLEDACLYAEDLYGVGYGCDGSVGGSDGDGICDATDTCDGVIVNAESALEQELWDAPTTLLATTMKMRPATTEVVSNWTIVASVEGLVCWMHRFYGVQL